jgi:glycine betaine catabolism A
MTDPRRPRLLPFPHAIARPESIPAARYFDRAFFELEGERLWPRVWQMACRLEEIPAVGDYVEYEILGRSVIVMRAAAGEIRAYHNACRHRGMRLVQGRGNAANGFVCPFHGWCWNADGSNKFVFAPNLFEKQQLEAGDLRLRSCRVETWGGCAFVNFDDDAPPLRDALEPFATYHDALRVDEMRAESWHATVLPVNWKLACEAFMEGYHAAQTHPQLLARSVKVGYGAGTDTVGFTDPADVVGSSLYFMKVLSEGMGGGMIHPRDIEVAESLKEMPRLERTAQRRDRSPRARGRHPRARSERARGDGARLVRELRVSALLPAAGLRQRRGLSCAPARAGGDAL